MNRTYVSLELRRLVMERAEMQCEYCRLAEMVSYYPHEFEHIIAKKHDGLTEANNLAYACARCNRFKGSDLGSFDPQTGQFAFLFNPRTQFWEDHFIVTADRLVGITPAGRVTVKLLQMNLEERVAERRMAREIGHSSF